MHKYIMTLSDKECKYLEGILNADERPEHDAMSTDLLLRLSGLVGIEEKTVETVEEFPRAASCENNDYEFLTLTGSQSPETKKELIQDGWIQASETNELPKKTTFKRAKLKSKPAHV